MPPQYSDLPQGASLIGGAPPAAQQYSDLPSGAKVLPSAGGGDVPFTSGTLDGKVPSGAVPSGLRGPVTPEENNKSSLLSGLNGVGKSLVDTFQSVHNNNTPKDPTLAPTFSASPMQGALDYDASAKSPDEMAGKVFGNIAQAAIPMGGAERMLPNADRAGAALTGMAERFAGHPVPLTKTVPALDRAAQLSVRGGGPMGAAGTLLDRSQGIVPLDFPEGRDYYSNVSNLTSMDKQSMSRPLKAQIGKVRGAFHSDLADTAGRIEPPTDTGYFGQPMNGGKAEYDNAIGEFRHAKQLEGAKDFLVKKAAPAGIAAGAGKMAYDKLRGH